MQVTIDIPEPLYGALASKATAARMSLETLVLRGAAQMVSEAQPEKTVSGRPTLSTMAVNLNDFALMTADEIEAFEHAFAHDPESAVRQFSVRKLNDDDAG